MTMRLLKQFSFLIYILCVLLISDATAQRNMSAKEMRRLLVGNWELKSLYKPNYEQMDEQSHYYPIDDNYIEQFVWKESDINEYRSSQDFDVDRIDLVANGNLKGDHYNGTQVNGKWRYKAGNKKRQTYFSISYTLQRDDAEEPDQYWLTFDRVEVKDNQLILIGDVCHDGCVLKVILARG